MKLFIESSCVSVNKHDQKLCGDFFLAKQDGGLSIAVLSDGLGSGVKANILATLTAQILITMMERGLPLSDCIATVAKTLPVCKVRNLAYSTFTVLRMDAARETAYLAQFDNPPAIRLRNGKNCPYARTKRIIGEKEVEESVIGLRKDDMLFLFTDGVTNVGLGKTLPDGWPHSDIVKFLEDSWFPGISPQRLAATLAEACVDLALGSPDDDITVVACKARERQTVNVMIGPPARREDDLAVLTQFFEKEGKHVICGGTTAKIAARYLEKSITVLEGTGTAEVPCMSHIEGLDLVTEGALTLGKTLELAEQYTSGTRVAFGIQNKTDGASALARLLWEEATDVRFFVGRAANTAHEAEGGKIGYAVKIGFLKQLRSYLEESGKSVEILKF